MQGSYARSARALGAFDRNEAVRAKNPIFSFSASSAKNHAERAFFCARLRRASGRAFPEPQFRFRMRALPELWAFLAATRLCGPNPPSLAFQPFGRKIMQSGYVSAPDCLERLAEPSLSLIRGFVCALCTSFGRFRPQRGCAAQIRHLYLSSLLGGKSCRAGIFLRPTAPSVWPSLP